MKKIIIRLYLLFLMIGAMVPGTSPAQTPAVRKAAQSVLSLTTFNKDGTIHSSSHAVLTGNTGEAVAMWHDFTGADRAIVIDAKGKQYDVDVMLGISENYDLCRFRLKGYSNAGASLPLVAVDSQPTAMYIVGYDLKSPSINTVKPQRTEKFMTNLNYYVFNDNDVSGSQLGCPLVNSQGQLLAIIQRPETGGQAFAADTRLTNDFKLTGLSINDNTFRATGIRTALPSDKEQAVVMLMLAVNQDSAKYEAYIDDFIRLFPTATEGYNARANRLMAAGRLTDADNMLQDEVKHAAQKDVAYSNYAAMVYRATVYRVDTTFTKWSLDRAVGLVKEAEKINPQPNYRQLEGQIRYAQGKYKEALDIFMALQQTALRKNGEIFLEAAQCKTMLKAPKAEIMALLDSAVCVQRGVASAPYVLARGRAYDSDGEYHKAFRDYLVYDSLMSGRGSDDFYYIKYKCEVNIRQYQIALNDIAHAIVLNPREPVYYAEMASLQLRVNQPDKAVQTCNLALRLPDADSLSDLYIIKGVALCETGKKEEGLDCLRTANEKGDSRAQKLIDKYNKK